jgi:diaminohydroxyphosphoribosylaminopyrimidine deaminase/5-amino-6-(5-phosphoribosylamino)uracil reductase
VNELHVEAGVTLNGSLARAGLVDEWLVYLAPMLLGAGRAMAELGELAGLDAAPRWQFLDHTPIGPDLRLRLRDPAAAEALLPR